MEEEFLTPPISLIAGLPRDQVERLSEDVINSLTNNSMIVDILDDMSGVKIHLAIFDIKEDFEAFGNLA